MTIWRIWLRPARVNASEFCIDKKVIGLGWGIDHKPANLQDYIAKLPDEKPEAKSQVRIFAIDIKNDDLVWTRNDSGIYYLGRVKGPWIYTEEEEFRQNNVANIRECEWHEIGLRDRVIGAILNYFVGPFQAIQKITKEIAATYSFYLYNKKTNTQTYPLPDVPGDMDPFSFFDDRDLEDIIGLYLQLKEGYVLYPSSCKKDLPKIEYILSSKDGKEQAYAQVKSGDQKIDIRDYIGKFSGRVYLFAVSGNYLNLEDKEKNIIVLHRKEIEDFIKEYKETLPEKIRNWLNLTEYLKQLK